MTKVAIDTTERYQDLANAVIVRASNDYIELLCEMGSRPRMSSRVKARYAAEEKELTDFFTGDWFKSLTNVDGPMLLKKLEDLVIEHDYDIKAIRKATQTETTE